MKKENVIKETYMKDIYFNVLKAIIIVLYFFILNVSYQNVQREYLLIGIKALTMIFLFIAIFIFEKAYNKDSDKLALQGIEVLVLAAYTLTTEHITNKFNFNFKSYSLVASYIFAIYYILRCILIYTKGRKELENDFSDIREIVKKEEPVQKEATKKSDKEKDKTKNDVKTEKKVEEKEIENVIETDKKSRTGEAPKKRKKVVKNEENNNTETAPKPRKKTTTTKFQIEENKTNTQTVKKDNTEKKETNKTKTTNTTPKKKTTSNTTKKVVKPDGEITEEKPKRKRVKKEVNEND